VIVETGEGGIGLAVDSGESRARKEAHIRNGGMGGRDAPAQLLEPSGHGGGIGVPR
jgi:hypothetical protein